MEELDNWAKETSLRWAKKFGELFNKGKYLDKKGVQHLLENVLKIGYQHALENKSND